MAGALTGVQIIDFGQYFPGPLAAMMLGDQGADVVHVDRRGTVAIPADTTDAVLNRGKRRITLDLKDSGDLETARRLVLGADVVIENFRPGVMARLGLGAEEMLNANPSLIYCSLPGFASDDPRAGVAAWEGVVGAATATYNGRGTPEPHFTAVSLASNFAAFTAVNSIVAALIARERTGRGQRVETPLFDAMFEAFGARAQRDMTPGAAHTPPPAGLPLDPLGGGFYQCRDDRWVQLLVMRPRHFDWFAAAAFPAGWADEGFADRARLHANPELALELRRRLIELFRTRTSWEWETFVNEAGTPCCVCRTTDEWLADAHAEATRAVVSVDDPLLGRTRQAGFPVSLAGSPSDNPGPRHLPDSDRAAILAELDAKANPVARSNGGQLSGALEGIRVIDTTQIWAGPTAGRVLAEYGAEVVKINEPGTDVLSHTHVNSGKRSLLLDLRTAAGLDVLWKLVERADVFMQNSRRGTAERLGVGYDDIRSHKADIIYSSVSAYGYDGPRGADRGWEPVGQASTGMEVRMGGDGSPTMQEYALCDYGTGLMGAFSMLLGLYHRARTGQGQAVQAALSLTGTLHQAPFMIGYEGQVRVEPSGPGAKGTSPFQRLYQASDGWFFLGMTDTDRPRLASAEGLIGLEGLEGGEFESAASARFATEPADAWVARLTAAGIGAHRLTTLEQVMEDPWAKAHQLSVARDHEGVGRLRMVGPSPRLSGTPVRVTSPVGLAGAEGREVLVELGLSEEAIDALCAAGVVALPAAARSAVAVGGS